MQVALVDYAFCFSLGSSRQALRLYQSNFDTDSNLVLYVVCNLVLNIHHFLYTIEEKGL